MEKSHTFVDLAKDGYVLEPRYHFFGWTYSPKVLGRKSLAVALRKARTFLPKGYNFKIWDCQRPRAVQLRMIASFRRRFAVAHPEWDKERLEKELYTFASRPKLKVVRLDHHRNGGAIDLTIVDAEGRELWMGTDHDDLTPVAALDYFEGRKLKRASDKEAQVNRRLLKKVLLKAGFEDYAPEWWHWGFSK